jgi:hypothetical protein
MKKLLYFVILLLFCLSITTCNPEDDEPVVEEDDTTATWFKCTIGDRIWEADQIVWAMYAYNLVSDPNAINHGYDQSYYINAYNSTENNSIIIFDECLTLLALNIDYEETLKSEIVFDSLHSQITGELIYIYNFENNVKDTVFLKFNKLPLNNFCPTPYEYLNIDTFSLYNKWTLYSITQNNKEFFLPCIHNVYYYDYPTFTFCQSPYLQNYNSFANYANKLDCSYLLTEGKLVINTGGSTMLGIFSLIFNYEVLYFYSLNDAFDYEINGNTLTLTSSKSNLKFYYDID